MRKRLGLVGVVAVLTLILIAVLLVEDESSQSASPDIAPVIIVAIYLFTTVVSKLWMVLGRKNKVINILSLILFVLVVWCLMINPNDAQTGWFSTLQLLVGACLIAMPVIDSYDLIMQFLLPMKW